MIVDGKICRTCIWYKANIVCGKEGCVLKRATLHMLFSRTAQITCYDFELYKYLL